jgi:hypothetical protein
MPFTNAALTVFTNDFETKSTFVHDVYVVSSCPLHQKPTKTAMCSFYEAHLLRMRDQMKKDLLREKNPPQLIFDSELSARFNSALTSSGQRVLSVSRQKPKTGDFGTVAISTTD